MKTFKEHFLIEAKTTEFYKDKHDKIFELMDESGQLFLVSINGMQKIKVSKKDLADYEKVKFNKKTNEYDSLQ